MKAAETNMQKLDKEYAAYRKVYRAIFWAYYTAVALLFYYLCRQVVENHGFIPAGFFAAMKELGAIAAIWYLFYLCDTQGGLLKILGYWEKSLLFRIRQEEAMDALREGGFYVSNDREMVLLEDKYLVPRDLVK